jgi:hypothetical protein
MAVSVILFMFFPLHFVEHGVEASVPLLDAGPVALDPGVHQVESLDIQAYVPGLRAGRPADEAGVFQYLQVLVDGLQ